MLRTSVLAGVISILTLNKVFSGWNSDGTVIANAALFETFLTINERSIMFYAISPRSRRGRMDDWNV